MICKLHLSCWPVYRWLCLLVVLMVWPLLIVAQSATLLPAQTINWAVSHFVEREATSLTLAQVQELAGQGAFKPLGPKGENFNYGFLRQGQWLRVRIDQVSESDATWVLELAYQAPDTVDVYRPDGSLVLAGTMRPRPAEQLEHRYLALPLRLAPGANDLLIRVQSTAALTIPLRIWAPVDFLKHVQRTSVLQALYYGALAAMVLYNLFLFLSLRDVRFGLYVLFALTLGAAMLSGNGYGRLYLWPDALAFDRVAQTFFLCLSGAFSVAFSRAFFQIDANMRGTAHLLRLAQAVLFGFALYFLASVAFGWPLHNVALGLIAVVLPTGVLIVWASVSALRQDRIGSRFFLLGWSVMWLGVFVASLRMLGWLPSNTLTLYALQISSVLEMLLLAFALVDSLRQERVQRDLAQATALRLEQNLVMQLQAAEERLEKTVQARTQELQSVLERQQLLLDQYVRFGSLISHEFRNPLGIIQSHISLLRRQWPTDEAEALRRLDIMTSSVRRLAQLFERWLQGGRLHHLEKDLQIEPVQLDLWLEHLLEAHPHYRATHRVTLVVPQADRYDGIDGSAPVLLIMADEPLLEIAVLNLLDNACKYAELGTEVRIELRARSAGGGPAQTAIAVIDQGPGISKEDQARIFDDYVRIKPEGTVHGIGLGLVFVKRIAQLLGGSIELCSLPGQGSTFYLWLPSQAAMPTP
jgi:two-component system, sensor histidine kinase LadS